MHEYAVDNFNFTFQLYIVLLILAIFLLYTVLILDSNITHEYTVWNNYEVAYFGYASKK